ncbi:ribbon-helix-helix protein, CopG family [Nocardioides humi]|uniref:Ribbon-helix-helix protein CopG domain-containing protein n=1 Tax=Nocardioides humi TaxID=449461 RepID=A0ABN2ASR1_9ACTN|nr:ribbon-helix-helix protein, CopG family [Nocardioides humi]
MSRPDVVFDRRVQLLLDQETYQRVADEAARTGRSVNAVLREAITARYADEEADARRAAAARELLEMMKASEHEPPFEGFDEDAYYENDWSREMKRLETEGRQASAS